MHNRPSGQDRPGGRRVGQTQRDDRYFRPDRDPVDLTGLRGETVKVGAGSDAATLVKPTTRTKGIFFEDGEAQVWLSDDAHRHPPRIESKFSRFPLTLDLQSVKPGDPASPAPLVAALTAR